MHLEGSYHCGAIKFSLDAPSPVPFLHCHLGGDFTTLRVRGEKHLGVYQAVLREPGKRPRRSPAKRHFCLNCGSPLWLWDPRWPDLVHPHASAIDTPLPKPPEIVDAGLDYAAPWVELPRQGHVHYGQWPAESLADWHKRHGLWW
ncbi:MAG: GFA family protein [Rhodocyclales bacterium]|nr:GFA family protein [Rhodocyclales bacterium]